MGGLRWHTSGHFGSGALGLSKGCCAVPVEAFVLELLFQQPDIISGREPLGQSFRHSGTSSSGIHIIAEFSLFEERQWIVSRHRRLKRCEFVSAKPSDFYSNLCCAGYILADRRRIQSKEQFPLPIILLQKE